MSDSAAHGAVADGAANGRPGAGPPPPAEQGARLTAAVTGGIGAGKSTVSRMLRGLGAIVIDSDLLARRVVEPGTEGLAAVVKTFGRRVLSEDDTLDRAALAEIVFASANADEARSRLERIIHPLVRAEFQRIAGQAPPGSVVVNDIPILRSRAAADEFDAVVAVVADESVRIARLIDRGLDEADARARIAAQIQDDERVALADYVIPNNGDEAELRRRVEDLWQELRSR